MAFLRAFPIVMVMACGPVVTPGETEAGSTGSDDVGSTGASPTSSTTVPGTTTSSSPTTSSGPNPTTVSTSVDPSTDDTSSEESSSTGDVCDCVGDPIGLDDEIEEGFRATDLVAATAFVDLAWWWPGLADDPTVAAGGGGTYRGGEIYDEVGGCCGSFICGPCPSGMSIHDLRFRIVTDDGLIDHAFVGRITGPDEYESMIVFESEKVPIEEISGTLGAQEFDIDGKPFWPAMVYVTAVWSWDTEFTLQNIYLHGENDFDSTYIGRYPAL